MARRQRNYAAEYAARVARDRAKGFKSTREATRLRSVARASGAPNPSKLTATQLRNMERYQSEARRVSSNLSPESRGIMRVREDKLNDPAYMEKYHRWAQLKQSGGVSSAERRNIVVELWAEQLDMDVEDLYDYYDDDGGSVPE